MRGSATTAVEADEGDNDQDETPSLPKGGDEGDHEEEPEDAWDQVVSGSSEIPDGFCLDKLENGEDGGSEGDETEDAGYFFDSGVVNVVAHGWGLLL